MFVKEGLKDDLKIQEWKYDEVLKYILKPSQMRSKHQV